MSQNKCELLSKVEHLEIELSKAQQELLEFQENCDHDYKEFYREFFYSSDLRNPKITIAYKCEKCGDQKHEIKDAALLTVIEHELLKER